MGGPPDAVYQNLRELAASRMIFRVRQELIGVALVGDGAHWQHSGTGSRTFLLPVPAQ